MRKSRSRATAPQHLNGAPQALAPGGSVRSICVYCGSGPGENPAYAQAARTLGRALAENGVRLVYGGGGFGLMGEVARATLEAGGKVTGIIPEFLVEREHMLREVTDLLVTADMHQRKKLMFERSDAFVALPGGIGTLEELVEQLTWAQLGQHSKPIVVANIAHFWTPFLSLLDHMRNEAFIRRGLEVPFSMVSDASQIVPRVTQLYAELGGKVAPGALAKF
ncbi:TIGR00730 family Rossman fold protein [Hyphomicrobium sp.]|uniref:LOG family protein n=1 Tax=Hyphomicrobium sp. TaxID=82 RepID=UPI0025BD203F|nr:TIGR00730 family Rossman fold protein [Hyphomicrobium sp.]MCC7252469.1 TIGR00730 family Rossman fold protein [Hyphomicrobium sp.]